MFMGITAKVRKVARAKREYRRLARGGQSPRLFVYYDNGEMVALAEAPSWDRPYMDVPNNGTLCAQVRWARRNFAVERWLKYVD